MSYHILVHYIKLCYAMLCYIVNLSFSNDYLVLSKYFLRTVWENLELQRKRVNDQFGSYNLTTSEISYNEIVKAHANGHNKSQHCFVLFGVFGQQCCVRLYGPKGFNGFKLYATSANKCQHCCCSMQTDVFGPNNVACCWPTMLRPFAWVLR